MFRFKFYSFTLPPCYAVRFFSLTVRLFRSSTLSCCTYLLHNKTHLSTKKLHWGHSIILNRRSKQLYFHKCLTTNSCVTFTFFTAFWKPKTFYSFIAKVLLFKRQNASVGNVPNIGKKDVPHGGVPRGGKFPGMFTIKGMNLEANKSFIYF